jgi:hypothetical protein
VQMNFRLLSIVMLVLCWGVTGSKYDLNIPEFTIACVSQSGSP